MNNFGELLGECWDSKHPENGTFKIKRTANPDNLLEKCRALEGKVPDDKDSEETKIKKLTEEFLDPRVRDRIEGLINIGHEQRFSDAAREILLDLVHEGFEPGDVIEYLSNQLAGISRDVLKDLGVEESIGDFLKSLIEKGSEPEAANESKVNEQDEPEDLDPSIPPEEPKEEPEDKRLPEPEPSAEEEAPEITKEYIGRSEDTHFYMVSTETDEGLVEDLELVDQEGVKKYSARDNNLDPAVVDDFIIQVIQDVQIDEIERSVFMKYILPKILEEEEPEPEEEEPEEEEKEKPEKAEKPEEEEEPVESKKTLSEMKIVDGMNNEFDVNLVDDGTEDTVIDINGREFRFDQEFASLWRDEDGTLSGEGLEELALDALANLEDDEYNELIGAAKIDQAEEEVDDVEKPEPGEPDRPLKDRPAREGVEEVKEDISRKEFLLRKIKKLEKEKETFEKENQRKLDQVEKELKALAAEGSGLKKEQKDRPAREVKEQKEIPVGYDINDVAIKKGDRVFADDGRVQGTVDAVWDDNSVDIQYTSGPGGPLSDTFDIKGHGVTKFSADNADEKKKPPVCKKCNKKHWPFEKCSVKKSEEKPTKESVEADEAEKEKEEVKENSSDLVDIANSRLGWAVAEQLKKILDVPTAEGIDDAELNPNAVRMIYRFVADRTDDDSETAKAAIEDWVEDGLGDPSVLEGKELPEAKMGVDYVKTLKKAVKTATTALKDKDYDAAAKALEDAADDASDAARAAKKMKRADDAKAEEEAKKEKEEEKPKEESIEDESAEEVVEDNTDEKKKPPVCKKCGKAHWPFEKCSESKLNETDIVALYREYQKENEPYEAIHKVATELDFDPQDVLDHLRLKNIIHPNIKTMQDVKSKLMPERKHWPFEKCGAVKKSKEKSEEGKVDEEKLSVADVKKLFKSIDPAFAKHLTGLLSSKHAIIKRGQEVGLELSTEGEELLSGKKEGKVPDDKDSEQKKVDELTEAEKPEEYAKRLLSDTSMNPAEVQRKIQDKYEFGPEDSEEIVGRALDALGESKLTEAEKLTKAQKRGDVVFKHESPKVTDDKDHYPINSEDQARNALARASQYKKAPKWYKGSLEALVKAVASAVHKKYPSIEITKAGKTPGKDGKKEAKEAIKVEQRKSSLDESKSMGHLKDLLGLS